MLTKKVSKFDDILNMHYNKIYVILNDYINIKDISKIIIEYRRTINMKFHKAIHCNVLHFVFSLNEYDFKIVFSSTEDFTVYSYTNEKLSCRRICKCLVIKYAILYRKKVFLIVF